MKSINQVRLAERWCISQKTLENWRNRGHGPQYLKIGKRVVYRICDIESFEEDNLHSPNIIGQNLK